MAARATCAHKPQSGLSRKVKSASASCAHVAARFTSKRDVTKSNRILINAPCPDPLRVRRVSRASVDAAPHDAREVTGCHFAAVVDRGRGQDGPQSGRLGQHGRLQAHRGRGLRSGHRLLPRILLTSLLDQRGKQVKPDAP